MTNIYIDHQRCDFCGTCVGVCPTNAIELLESHIFVVDEICIRCGDCIDICPLGIPREVS